MNAHRVAVFSSLAKKVLSPRPRAPILKLALAGALLLLTGCSYANGGRGMIPVGAGDVVDTWKHRVTVEPRTCRAPCRSYSSYTDATDSARCPASSTRTRGPGCRPSRRPGWRFVAPDSWARGTWNRADGCTADLETARAVRLLRLEEIAYAVRQLAADPTVDQKRIVLLGHSEGGLAVATAAPPKTVVGIVISGWMCHSSVPLGCRHRRSAQPSGAGHSVRARLLHRS